MPFTTMGLIDPLVQGILATGYNAPTEIQSQAIPAALAGHDIIGCAQTGTGKTAAFVLPMLQKLFHNPIAKRRRIKSLILTPTRELAVQIERAIAGYGRFLDIIPLAVYGGAPIQGQFKPLRRGVDIVVATPGRLMDHMNRGTIDLQQVEILVLDEADRMMDMGFINDMKKIIAKLPTKRQTLMFSATVSPEIQKLAGDILTEPKMIQIGRPRNPIETITQHICPVPAEQKMDLLLHLLDDDAMDSVLVFSRTKHGADKICRKLKLADIDAVAIHSNRTQKQRQQALDGFKRGKYQVMVATDIAARGINVEGISHVVNYDVPAFAEDYIHRIGRTGRAAATGDAITFVSHDEIKHIRKIEGFIGRTFEPKNIDGFAYKHTVSLDKKPNESGKKSKPGSSQRQRAKTQQGQHPAAAKPGSFKQSRFKKPKQKTTSENSDQQQNRPNNSGGGYQPGSKNQGGKKKPFKKFGKSKPANSFKKRARD
ncbi:MAG: DEAD/DEAH box helicase [Phycisphaerae bacterium]|nr:DEAD/DEAH box helicase [Phycisphaerae bacterium]